MRIDRDIADKSKGILHTSLERVTNNLSEKDSENVLLKQSIKHLNEGQNVYKVEQSKAKKEAKEKEKEINRLDTKADNLAINLKK